MANKSNDDARVAYIGLGAMGFAMSTHLVRQGEQITGFDIWKPTLDKFEATCKAIPNAKFSTATSPSEAVKSADVVIFMVATHHHVNSALFEGDNCAIKSLKPNSTIIITSTVPPMYPLQVRERLDTEFSRSDIKLIDAPVSGGTVRSADGTVTIMASSDDEQIFANPKVARVLHTVSSDGKTLFVIPGTLGAGTSAKALNQVQCGVHIVSGSEIMAIAAVQGLNTRKFYDKMKTPDPEGNPYGWTWMFENRGPRMLDPDLPISSAVSIINKDVGIIHDEETRLRITLPILNKVYDLLAAAMGAGMASVDDAWLNRFYLGLKTDKEMLAVERSTSTAGNERADILLCAHAMVNLQSAYETFLFAEALDLLGESQRQMWYTIIAGAAGGSRVFTEVIPIAFQSLQSDGNWKAGFQTYAKEMFGTKFGPLLPEVENLINDAKSAGVNPELIETAFAFVKSLL